jgi:DNA-binding LacI/PurR family transcriptional regulator
MPTIQDVAHEAGVGVGTVSRVLSGSPRVSDSTRARVRAVVERLGYQPSPIARAFSRGRTQTLEVIVPLFTRYFYVEVLRGIEEALASTDYALLVRSIERRADRDRLFQQPRVRGREDGALIVSLTPTRGLIECFAAVGLPLVLVDAEYPRVPSVAIDHEAAAVMAVRHLVGLGHRRIAVIDRPVEPFTPVSPDARTRGYRRAMQEAGLHPPPDYERVTDYSSEAGAAVMEELLALPEPPTAVFAGSDAQAIGVLDAARRSGRRVPEDLAVVGYNDVEISRYLGLTSVRVPMREMGRRGIALLLRALEEPSTPPEHVRLPAELVVRQTCGAT